jgi:hypothetical protein
MILYNHPYVERHEPRKEAEINKDSTCTAAVATGLLK